MFRLDVLRQVVQLLRRVKVPARSTAEQGRWTGIVTELKTKFGRRSDAASAVSEGLDVDGRLPQAFAVAWGCWRGLETIKNNITLKYVSNVYSVRIGANLLTENAKCVKGILLASEKLSKY